MNVGVNLSVAVADEGVPQEEIVAEIKRVLEKSLAGKSLMYSYTNKKKAPIYIDIEGVEVKK